MWYEAGNLCFPKDHQYLEKLFGRNPFKTMLQPLDLSVDFIDNKTQ